MNPKPFKTGYLPKQDGHKVYFAEYGNPKGEAVVVLHGGPGSKSKPKQASTYNLLKYHVITFDQRGCGKSTPIGRLSANTTQKSVSDIERLRVKLGLEKLFVAGSSWGFTLALAYAEAHPDKVRGLLLGSGFLGRARDVEWSFTKEGGIDRIFPDLWETRLKFLSKHKASPANAAKILLKEMETGSEKTIKEIAAGVSNWEGNLMNAQADLSFVDPEDIEEEDIAEVKVFLHYESNNFFLAENELIKNIGKIKSIPAVIIHGRYDLLCPTEQIWEVSKNLDKVETIILPTSNHRLTADGEVARKLAYNFFLSRFTNK